MDMTNSQQVTLTLAPKDRRGRDAPVDGTPVWASSDETLITVEPAADGMSAVVKAVGPTGGGRVTAVADADLGEGTTPITGVAEFTITAGQATVLELIGGTPEEQP